jgi:phosphatidylglycerophosphate synthase
MDKTLHSQTDMLSHDTAVILASGDRMQSTARGAEGSPLIRRVGGLSVFQRAVFTLQRAGFSQVLVLAGEEEEELRRLVKGDPRLFIPVRWRPIREFPPEEPKTWHILAGEVRGSCLVLGGHLVFSRNLVEFLRQEVRNGQPVLLVNRGDAPEPLCGAESQALASAAGSVADMLIVPAGWLGDCGGVRAGSPGSRLQISEAFQATPLPGLLDKALVNGGLRTVAASSVSPHWYQEVRDAPGAKRAEDVLLRSLTSELDGIVDKYFNRKLSGALTKLFLRMGLSPNAITIVSMVIGLMSAACFVLGTYTAGIIGALLFQFSAIVDCCDGEVARLTFTESPFGAQLDITADNVVHMAIFAGIAWAEYAGHGGWLSLALGLCAVTGVAGSQWQVDRARRLRRSGWSQPDQAGRSNALLSHMANRDFSLILLAFAVTNTLDWFLRLAAIGSNIFWVLLAWFTRPSAPARG